MWRRLVSAEAGVFLTIWLALMLFGRSALLCDPGTLWHTVVGQRMLDSGRVIDEDPFSFTAGGERWVAQWWAAECGMAVVHRLGGWDMLLTITATLLAGTYAWIAGRFFRRGFHVLGVGLVLALVLLSSSHQFHARPLLVTIAFLGVTFALLIDVEAGRGRLRRLWWCVPLTVVWANMHGGVLAGLGTVGLVVAGWCVAWLAGRESPIRGPRDLVAAIGLGAACGLAVLVNPYGVDLPRAWYETLTMPLPGLIHEHGRLDFADPYGLMTVLLGLGYVVALIGVFPRRPRITWLLPLVWFVLACQRIRHAPLFAIAAVIAAAEMLPMTRWAGWLGRRELLLPTSEDGAARRSWHWGLLPAALIALVLAMQSAGVHAPLVGRGWAEFDARRCPVELIPKLQEIDRDTPDGTPIFNDLNLGGFVIFYAPGLRVFIDDRCALYGAERLTGYDNARRENPATIEKWRGEYGFRHALVERGTAFNRYLADSPRWAKIQEAPAASLYRYEGTEASEQ